MEQDIEIYYNAYGAISISAQKDNFLIGSIVSLILQCLKETLILPIFEFLTSDIIQYALYCANSSTNIISVRSVVASYQFVPFYCFMVFHHIQIVYLPNPLLMDIWAAKSIPARVFWWIYTLICVRSIYPH